MYEDTIININMQKLALKRSERMDYELQLQLADWIEVQQNLRLMIN